MTTLNLSYKIYVSVKRNNLLHKIMLTATCFDSQQAFQYHILECILGSQKLTMSSIFAVTCEVGDVFAIFTLVYFGTTFLLRHCLLK